MSRGLALKLALSLAAVLVLGQLQCVAACVSFFAAQSANASLPPCHRHHDSKHSGDSSDACTHEISSTAVVAHDISTPAPQFASISAAILLQPASVPITAATLIAGAPPGLSPIAVLRI